MRKKSGSEKKNKKTEAFDSILLQLEFMKNQPKRSKLLLEFINQCEAVTIESNNVLQNETETLGIKTSKFLNNLQQATRLDTR